MAEELSKNALKKKLKAEEAAKKKAEKDAEKEAKKSTEVKKEKAGGDDEEVDPTKYFENRSAVINKLGVR
jgi:lysyl-tRNA synthetase class 2